MSGFKNKFLNLTTLRLNFFGLPWPSYIYVISGPMPGGGWGGHGLPLFCVASRFKAAVKGEKALAPGASRHGVRRGKRCVAHAPIGDVIM